MLPFSRLAKLLASRLTRTQLQAYSRCQDPQAAFQVLEDMLRLGIRPEVRTYNALIQAAGKHHMQDKARGFYGQLLSEGLHPEAHTFSLLFQAFCSRPHRAGAWLLQVADSMPRYGVPASDYTIVGLLNAVRQASLNRSQVVRVAQMITVWLKQHSWNGTSYAAMLCFCADHYEVGAGLVRSIWDSAQQAEVFWHHLPPAPTPSARLAEHPSGTRRGHGDPIISYSALVHAYCKCGFLDEAVAVYKSIRSKGAVPTLRTFNILISGYAQAGKTKEAFAVFEDMQQQGMVPDAVTYGALMHACAVSGSLRQAASIFDKLEAQGLQPSAEIYTAYIDAHIKAHHVARSATSLQRAFEVYDEMRQRNIEPTAVTFSCLLPACRELGDADKAFELYRQSCALGLKDNSAILDQLIQVCATTNRLDEGLDLVKQLQSSHGHDASAMGLDTLTRALAGTSVDRALRMLSLLRTRGAQPSHATLLRLMVASAKDGRPLEARRLYWELRRQGAEASSNAGSEVILALCHASAALHALKIFDDMMPASGADAASQSQADLAWEQLCPQSEADLGADHHIDLHSAEAISVPGRIQVVPEAQDLNSVLTNELENWVSAKGSRGRQPSRHAGKKPHADAMAELVHALVSEGELRLAMRVYSAMRLRGSRGVRTVRTCQHMWQSLIEACCRANRIHDALKVFDDWKAFSQRQMASQALNPTPVRLSNVTLAFLEARCKEGPYAWRVYDVCAEMRQQAEFRRQAHLAHPRKASHHFYEDESKKASSW
ncbi:hypothetical protein WJX73_006839 [Symbiochloris irregularis]|uniref:PROP1-like PPR domain-containing protein n=1 Tax=Symbiochloris irregularis TaxID=706552 RepID=A0AAW1NYE4_9CHLO